MQYAYHAGQPATGGCYYIAARNLLMLDKTDEKGSELDPFGFQANPDRPSEPWEFTYTHGGTPMTANCVAWADYGYGFSLEFSTDVPALTEQIVFSSPSADKHFYVGDTPVARMWVGPLPVTAAYFGDRQVLG